MDEIRQLEAIIAASIERDVAPAVRQVAADLARRIGPTVAAILFYGSCLRTGLIDGQVLDFYVIVDDYRAAYRKRWLAYANRLLPPNVFYYHGDVDGMHVRAKYAVLAQGHLDRLVGTGAFNPSIWARFAQPIALAYGRDTVARQRIVASLATAPVTLLGKTAALAPDSPTPRARWRHAFALTYATEFRAERAEKPAELFDLESAFYEAVTGPALKLASAALGVPGVASTLRARQLARLAWFLRRVQGRVLHIFRLIKATATFDGGVDYLAWKIERHSGVPITVKPWHRRHPVIAGLVLLPRLKGKGAVR